MKKNVVIVVLFAIIAVMGIMLYNSEKDVSEYASLYAEAQYTVDQTKTFGLLMYHVLKDKDASIQQMIPNTYSVCDKRMNCVNADINGNLFVVDDITNF